MKWLSLLLLFLAAPAWAQGIGNCSQTVGASAAPVVFPASAGGGNPQPTSNLEICDSHASQTLGINWVGGTAAIGSAGTLTLPAGGCKKWTAPVDTYVPAAVSIIGSGASTTTTCTYK